MGGDGTLQGADVALHADLARANVLRMRGDSKAAEEACLAILRRYPNNPAAHTLLGDVFAERCDLEQAAQWYELALDLEPESRADRQRLEEIRARMAERDAASTAAQIGLSTKRARSSLPLVAAAGTIALALGVGAGYALAQANRPTPRRPILTRTIQAPVDPIPERPLPLPDDASPTSLAIAPSEAPEEDRALLTLLAGSPEASRISAASSDPRARTVVVTYRLQPNEDDRRTGATVAKAALDRLSDVTSVTVRGVRDGKLVYAADAPRALYAETQTSAWQAAHPGDPDAWITHLMQNEWRASNPTPPATTPTPAPQGQPAPGT